MSATVIDKEVEGARRKRPGGRREEEEDGTGREGLPSTALRRQAPHVIRTGEGRATGPAVAFVFANGEGVWRSR